MDEAITQIFDAQSGLTRFQRRNGTEEHRRVIDWLRPRLEQLEAEARIELVAQQNGHGKAPS